MGKFGILATFVVCLAVGHFAFAHEEAPAEKGEGGGEKKATEAPPEWMEVQTSIMQLEGKIQQKRESITKLLEEKEHAPEGSPQLKEIITDLMKEHKELQGFADDYDKQIVILKFRYPERGAKAGRKYEPIEVKPLEQMERELNVDGRLTRNLKKAREQYGSASKDKSASPTPAETKAADKPKATEPSIDEAGVIVLKK